MTLFIIFSYLILVLVIGAWSHRLFRGTGEDYFVASRSIGPFLLLMSLFGTNTFARARYFGWAFGGRCVGGCDVFFGFAVQRQEPLLLL